MSYIIGNNNGLIPRSETAYGPGSNDNYYVKVGADGSAVIDNDLLVKDDLTVNGNIYASTIISIPEASGNPFYIKNPNNIGEIPITDSALVVEGGANRTDAPLEGPAITLYKPFTANQPGLQEDIGTLQFAGRNTNPAGEIVRYASIRAECTDPTNNLHKGRIEFQVLNNNIHGSIMTMDASSNAIATANSSRFADRGYNLYPAGVKITNAGAITKQTSAVVVPESAFTIPVGLDGYYSFTAQIILGTIGTVADGDNISIYLDVSGGSLSPVLGTVNILDMTENSASSFSATPGGIIMQRLTAGQVIQLYHIETGSYLFGSGSIQVAYNYLGDTLLA